MSSSPLPTIVTVSASSPWYTSFLQSRKVVRRDRTESGHCQEVSHADAGTRERAAWQFDRRLGPADDTRYPPRPEPVVQPYDVAVAVDECDIDRKSHEEHVDRAARTQTEAGIGPQLAAAHQAQESLPGRIRHRHRTGDCCARGCGQAKASLSRGHDRMLTADLQRVAAVA